MKLRAVVATVAALFASVLISAPAHAASPDVSWDYNSVSTVYPVSDGYIDTIRFTWAVSPQPSTLTLDVYRADTQTSVFTVALDPTATSYTWNGSTDAGPLATAGDYYPVLSADNGVDPVASAAGWQFTVSSKALVSKRWTKTVSASGSLRAKQVGSCSTLRKPGLKLGRGSLGYYSLTRCSQTSRGRGVIATVHALTLPAAFRPGAIRFSVYGGALRRTGSVGFVPLDKAQNGIDAAVRILPRAVGWHPIPAVKATTMLTSSRLIRWGVAALDRSRYDIRSFRVTYTYTVLQ